MISAIEDWIRLGRNYQKGVELFAIHGSSAVLNSLFASAESSFTRDKLYEELKRLSAAAEVPAKEIKEKDLPINAFRSNQDSKYVKIDFVKLPDQLKEKYRLKEALFKQSSEAFYELNNAVTEDDRYTFASTIIDNFRASDPIWRELEEFQLNGIIKSQQDPDALDKATALELAIKLENVKKLYSKVAKKPDKKLQAEDLLKQRKEIELALELR